MPPGDRTGVLASRKERAVRWDLAGGEEEAGEPEGLPGGKKSRRHTVWEPVSAPLRGENEGWRKLWSFGETFLFYYLTI